jgi:hypothetical protein
MRKQQQAMLEEHAPHHTCNIMLLLAIPRTQKQPCIRVMLLFDHTSDDWLLLLLVPTFMLPGISQVWEGYCCPSNAVCVRGNEFYYQCLPKPGASNAANAPNNAARNAPAPVAGNPPTDAVIAAPPQEPVIVAPPEKPVAAKMKGGGSHTSHELPLWLHDCFKCASPPQLGAFIMSHAAGLTTSIADPEWS